MLRPSLHLGSLGDLLGTLILLTLPSSTAPVVQRIEMGTTGCGAVDERCGCCMSPLTVAIAPRRLTLRLAQAQLLEFEPTFDAGGKAGLEPLKTALVDVHQQFPDLSSLLLEVDDDVELGLVIAVADLGIGAGLPSLTATPARAPVGSSSLTLGQ